MSELGNGGPLTGAQAVAIACVLLVGAGAARAQGRGNVRIDNVTVAPRDARTATVRFDISWKNSWRHEANHDAAWLFFKVLAEGATEWQHVRLTADKVLNPTGYGHGKGTPVDLIVPDGDDGFTGMFVRRAGYGRPGTLATRAVTAVWDLRANKGITKDSKVRMQAFGIVMVYVAEGPFYLGSGGAELNGFYMYTDGSQHTLPYRVTSAGAIPTGRQKGRLWARSSEPFSATPAAQPEDGGEIPASFPNGYAAFYCMRYPITFVQYADFMNTLTPAQAKERYSPRAVRRKGKPPNYTYSPQSGPEVREGPGCHSLSWADGAVFAAWAGLRPMTELEYAKAVRGRREPLPDETGPSYWNIGGWAGWDWFSYHPNQQCDRPVTVGNGVGRRFKGTHGRGTLTLPADWPQDDAVGAGIRGGGSQTGRGLQRVRVSDRLHAADADAERSRLNRWRGVRTAPKQAGK